MAILAGGKNTQQKLIPHCVIESADDTHQYDHLTGSTWSQDLAIQKEISPI